MANANEIYVAAGFIEKGGISSLRDVPAADFIAAYAAHLKKGGKIELPEWVDVVKTASGRELPPMDLDWYFTRAASVARKIYLNSGLGVGALARWYGKATRNGGKPAHHHYASRAVIRHVLIQLQSLGVVETMDKGGRRLTKEGQKDLDTIARSLLAEAE